MAAFTGLPAAGLVAVAACAGFADGWTEIVYTSRLQAAPDRQRSRLFGMSATAETAASPWAPYSQRRPSKRCPP
ncbi:hypothetical protein ACFQVA_00525 [Actinomadura keratinilytica]